MMDRDDQWHVFVSHNRKDKPWVRRLVAQWQDELGLRVFFDEDSIAPGADIVRALDEGLRHSRHVVLIISPAAMVGEWIALETPVALYRDPSPARRRLTPVLIDPTEPAAIPLVIQRLN